jgi:hypothetical protein
MAEIDDAELDTLRKARGLLDGLLRDPKTKRNVEREIKKLHPDTVITDDFDAPIMDEIKAIRKDVGDFLKAQNESRVDATLQAEFDALRRDSGYTDEGIEKIKAIMKERTIPDPMAAAALYEKLNPPPKPQQPSSFNGMGWGIGAPSEEPDTKLLFDNEDAFAEQEAGRFFQELAQTK